MTQMKALALSAAFLFAVLGATSIVGCGGGSKENESVNVDNPEAIAKQKAAMENFYKSKMQKKK